MRFGVVVNIHCAIPPTTYIFTVNPSNKYEIVANLGLVLVLDKVFWSKLQP